MLKLQLSNDNRERMVQKFKNVASYAVNEIRSRSHAGKADASDVIDWIAHFLMGAAESGNWEALNSALSSAEKDRPHSALERGEKMGPGLHRILNAEMKPCPFCGGEPYLSEVRNQSSSQGEHRMCVQCSVCLARTKVEVWKLRMPDSEKDLPENVKWKVINFWNNREAPKQG